MKKFNFVLKFTALVLSALLLVSLSGCSLPEISESSEAEVTSASEANDNSSSVEDESSSGPKSRLAGLSREEIIALDLTDEQISLLSQEDFDIFNSFMWELTSEHLAAAEEITAETAYYAYQPCVSDLSAVSMRYDLYQEMITPEKLELARQYTMPPLDNIVFADCPMDKMAIIDSDGNAYLWGFNYYGTLGDGTNIVRQLPQKLPIENIRLLRVNHYSAFAVTDSGELYAWGNNSSGMLGLGEDKAIERIEYRNYPITHYTPEKVNFDKSIKDIVNNGWYTAILTEDGEVYRCGVQMEKNRNYMDISFGIDEPDYPVERIFDFTKLELPEKIISVSCGGSNYVFASESGKVYVLGLFGDQNGSEFYEEVTEIEFPEPIVKVHAYLGTFFAISEDGTLYGYGSNSGSALCNEDTSLFFSEPVKLLENIRDIDGTRAFIALTNDGTCYGWGENYCNIFQNSPDNVQDIDLSVKAPIVSTPVLIPLPEKAAMCSIDNGRCVVLGESGTVYFWGKDSTNYSLVPGFVPDDYRDIPYSERRIVAKPTPLGS